MSPPGMRGTWSPASSPWQSSATEMLLWCFSTWRQCNTSALVMAPSSWSDREKKTESKQERLSQSSRVVCFHMVSSHTPWTGQCSHETSLIPVVFGLVKLKNLESCYLCGCQPPHRCSPVLWGTVPKASSPQPCYLQEPSEEQQDSRSQSRSSASWGGTGRHWRGTWWCQCCCCSASGASGTGLHIALSPPQTAAQGTAKQQGRKSVLGQAGMSTRTERQQGGCTGMRGSPIPLFWGEWCSFKSLHS